MAMRILVTGGAGFIGSHVVEAYLSAGHDVVIVDDLATGALSNVAAGAGFTEMDILSDELERVFEAFKPDVVNHHAAQQSVSRSVKDPVSDAQINILGTLNLLRNCARFGVRKIILASSGGTVYGEGIRFPASETDPVGAASPYGISKLACEQYVRFYRTSDITHTILRYSNVYGPRQDPHGESGVVSIFCKALMNGVSPEVYGVSERGDGGCVRDYVYVSDVARASVLALDSGDDETLNIGTGVETTTLELYETIRRNSFHKELQPIWASPRKGDVARNSLNPARAKRVLNWSPSVTLQDGVRATMDSFTSVSPELAG
jgi:UDP-glucose 4-epimerase